MRRSPFALILVVALLTVTGAHAVDAPLAPAWEGLPECSRPAPLNFDAPSPPEMDAAVSRTVLDATSGAGTDVEILRSPSGALLLAHKRYTAPPAGDSVAVALVVLRSEDNGATWSERVVDAELTEGAVVARDVSFAAASDGAIYLAYASTPGGDPGDAILNVARSTDDGRTWATVSTLPRGTGAYTGLGEVEPGRLLLAATHVVRGGSFSATVPAVAESVDGGATWSLRELAAPIEHGATDVALGVDGVGGAAASWYDPSAGTDSSQKLTASARTASGWRWSTVAEGCVRAGLGPDTISPGPGAFRTTYFNWTSPPRVDLATSTDGGLTWSNVAVDAKHVQRSIETSRSGEPLWPTALDQWDAMRLVVVYGWVTQQAQDPLFQTSQVDRSLARLAVSSDGGATWQHRTLDLDQDRGRYHDVVALPDGDALVAIQEGVGAQGALVLLRVDLGA